MAIKRLDELPAHLDPHCLLLSNLNRETIAETLNDYFNKVGEVDRVEIDLDDRNRSKCSAIILFAHPLTDYNIILSNLRIDGKAVQIEFAPKGFAATHPWRDTSRKSDRTWVIAKAFSLGTMLAPKTFVNMWSCERDVSVIMDFAARLMSVRFQHLSHTYRMEFPFNNIDGEIKLEREENTTHFTFTLRCPARTFRERYIQEQPSLQQPPLPQQQQLRQRQYQQPGGNRYSRNSSNNHGYNNCGMSSNNYNNNRSAPPGRPEVRATKKDVTRIWERIMEIPLDAQAQQLINQEPNGKRIPISPEHPAHRINLAAWRTYRLKFETTEDWMLNEFETMLQYAAQFNLIPQKFNVRRQLPLRVLPASQLSEPVHTHSRRASQINDFDVLYYLECAVTQGLIDQVSLDDTLYETLNEVGHAGAKYPRGILLALLQESSRIWKPYDAIYKIFSQNGLKIAADLAVPNHCVQIRKVIVTPTTLYLQTPTLEVSNRVVRHFSEHADRFLRVQFMDEGMTRIAATFGGESSDAIYARIYKTLQNGIQIGARRYDFLAFSSSQLRNHGCWFFAPTKELTPGMIRAWMGTFSHVKTIAKNAVRMGQCFSTTTPTIQLNENQVEVIDDIERNGYTFSDGVGKISPGLARDVAQHLQLEATPSCFQFRLGGAKGVLSLSNYMNGRRIQLRPSQIKFDSTHTMLEVIRTSNYLPAYLNRQAITLLSCLGIKDQVFMQMTQKMVNSMNNMLSNPTNATKLICQNMDEHGNASTMARIISSGFLERRDPYISNMLNVFRVSKLKDLKERARIHVAKGAFLLGMLDETDSLEEGEIYVRVADTANDATSRRRPPIVGPCVIFRNPCFHPGDVRTVIAVDCPKLRHLYDVVVFSAKGFRDLPSMLSGGDLDGDDYTVIWDETLLPPKANYSPFSYKSEDPIQVDQVKIGHIQKFFVNYINNDNLGQIANSHLAISDKSPMGAMDGRCVRLAQLHSLAVDFPKTGRPARFDDDLRARMFPDFMQKQDKRSYQSDKVLGRIYRYIESSDYEHYREKLLEDSTYDPRVWLAGSEEYIIEARDTQTRYNRDICALMNQYGVYTEAELVSGYVMEWKKRTSTRKSMFEQTTQVVRAVKLMQKSYRKEFLTNIDKKDEPLSKDALELKAAAWYYVTYHPKERLRFQSTETRALFSFPWVAYDYICEIAVRNTHRLVEQSMLDPIPETLIDLHRKDMFADIRIASYTIDSDEDDDDDDDDDDEEEEDDDDDDDDDPDDDDEDADDGELEDSMPTFKISDIKKQLQQKDTQPRVHHAETAAASSSTSTAPNFAPPLGTYVEIGADVTDEQLQQLLTL